jgi:cell pole-organizing protein PopZ
MAEQNAENEPSMEEILSSIRRIINEDEDEAPAEEVEAAAEPAPDEDLGQDAVDNMFDEPLPEEEPAAEEEDVLELTDMVDEPAPMDLEDDLLVVDEVEEILPEPEPEIDFSALDHDVEAGIMGEPATQATMGSFHHLSESIRISDEEGKTLEGVVRALLRPMLKDWLDENLPRVVEEQVQAEIARVSRHR